MGLCTEEQVWPHRTRTTESTKYFSPQSPIATIDLCWRESKGLVLKEGRARKGIARGRKPEVLRGKRQLVPKGEIRGSSQYVRG